MVKDFFDEMQGTDFFFFGIRSNNIIHVRFNELIKKLTTSNWIKMKLLKPS